MTTYVLYCGVLITFEEYKAKLLKTRLCDVKIIVWGDGQPKTIEQISYAEYAVIKPYLIKEGE